MSFKYLNFFQVICQNSQLSIIKIIFYYLPAVISIRSSFNFVKIKEFKTNFRFNYSLIRATYFLNTNTNILNCPIVWNSGDFCDSGYPGKVAK